MMGTSLYFDAVPENEFAGLLYLYGSQSKLPFESPHWKCPLDDIYLIVKSEVPLQLLDLVLKQQGPFGLSGRKEF